MVWTHDNVRYCLLCFDDYEQIEDNLHGDKDIPISGLYNWANALNGKRMFPRTIEEFAQFNLFHINITAKNLLLINKVLKKMPIGSKLLVNVDFALELWQQAFSHPNHFLDQINKADYIFAVEPLMAEYLSLNLKRNIPCIPHPVAIEKLKSFRQEQRLNQIGVSLHRYDMNYLLPYFLINQFDDFWQTIAIGSTQNKKDFLHIFDFIKNACPFSELMELTASLHSVLETYTIHSYGRYTVECAALGVPCVGSKVVSSISKCFPDLATDTNDISSQLKLFNKLFNDIDFYLDVVYKGQTASEEYSFVNSSNKLFSFLNAGC